ncbi:unnamed protein product [Prorocentrum cordatum]|uniref:TPM domain-containing protein n=1 Tax=Prorocentrum cordatum TaxID=2364126 RepID=A0ABN9YBI2_9DINO|nr:unnamed protein product [Polarella glacialis]
MAPSYVAGGGAGSAWAADGAVSSVLDNVGLLTPETREYLEKMVGQVEADTGLKMRVILPKPGQYTDKEYMKPVAVAWGVDRTSLILIVEDAKGGAVANTGKSRGPGAFGKRYLDWSPGFRLQEKYQFRLSRDFFLRNKGKFGTPEYVKENGLDGAVRDAARDVATCYYKLAASQATQNGMASPICGDPFPREQVDAVLGEHGL